MLRKLFISLIILSALTTDASAFSAYMLSMGISPEILLNHLEDSRILPEPAGKLYIATSDEIIQARTLQCRLVFVLPEAISLQEDCSCGTDIEQQPFKSDYGIIIFGSDSSPPYC